MPSEFIDSPQNAKVKAVARLRTPRGRKQHQKIIIDGSREIARAISSGLDVESIYVVDPTHADALVGPHRIVQLSERAFAKVAFGDRQEPVAVASMPNWSLLDLEKTNLRRVGVLERIEKPGNVGAVLRSADGAGLDAVVLVDPIVDLFNPNVIRSSVGTVFSVPIAQATFTQYLDWSRKRGLRQILAKCDSSSISYLAADFEGDVAIVLGNEAEGLSAHWNDLENATPITIPMAGIADSLNISAAAAILFFHCQSENS